MNKICGIIADRNYICIQCITKLCIIYSDIENSVSWPSLVCYEYVIEANWLTAILYELYALVGT